MLLEAHRCGGPVHGRFAHRLACPERQTGIEVAAADSLVEPTEPAEHRRVVVDDVVHRKPRPGLEADHVYALLSGLVRPLPAAPPGPHHHHHRTLLAPLALAHPYVL